MAFQWELVSFDAWSQDVLSDSGEPVLSDTGDRETTLVAGEEWITVRGHQRLAESEWSNGVLEAAAREAATCVQRELHEAPPAARLEAILLDHARGLYLLALYELSVYAFGRKTWRLAKQVEAECSPQGPPLAICMGTHGSSVVRKKPGVGSETLVAVGLRNGKTHYERLGPYGGCLGTFPDRPFSRGNCWPTWCPTCEPRKSNEKAAAIARRRREWSSP
jgi:hypothetical protein